MSRTKKPVSVSRLRARWQRRDIALWIVIVLVLIGMNAAVLGGMAALGVPLLAGSGGVAQTDENAAAQEAEAPEAATVRTPARAVIQEVLDRTPDGWKPEGNITWAAGTVFGWACGPTEGPAPVVSGQRSFKTPDGPVSVELRAYGAGAGAVAFDELSKQIGNCRTSDTSVGRYTSVLGNTEAMIGWIDPNSGSPGANSLFWRRGDVIASITTSGSPYSLSTDATAVDRPLRAALIEVCADPKSTLKDALRSPWISRKAYEGMWEPIPVVLPSPGAYAAKVPGPSPAPTPLVPEDWEQPVSVPSVSLPPAPAEPYWPSQLPIPVPSPKKSPKAPGPVPTAEQVRIKVEDEVGPGCGWAFTGQAPPVFDEVVNQQQVDTEVAAANDRLLAAQQEWVKDVNAYNAKNAAWIEQLYAFQQYADNVNEVVTAWQVIEDQRAAYVLAVEEWRAARAARKQFLADQEAAQVEFDAQIEACSTYEPPTPVTPSPYVVTPSPTPTTLPDGTVTTPTPTPYVTTPPPFTPEPEITCPPERPEILDQTPPTVPAKPSPPMNPVPTETGYDPAALEEANMPTPTPSPTPSPAFSPTATPSPSR